MKKESWPWIGKTQNEMGSMSPQGDFSDRQKESPAPYDSLAPEKSVLDDAEPSMEYSGGIISPVENVSLASNKNEDKKWSEDNSIFLTNINISNEEGLVSKFSCNVAKTYQEKVVGLQSYSNLKETAGLLFPYQRPEDVIYHMGTVKFPIDILFVDDKNRIKKIYKNIEPGTLGTFSCTSVKNVLEICGGLSDRLGIAIGNRVEISDYKADNLNKISSYLGAKNVIFKYSKFGKNTFSQWKNFPILTLNNKLKKTAKISYPISDLVTSISNLNDDKIIFAFNIDHLLEKNPYIDIYKKDQYNEDFLYRDLDNQCVNIKSATRNIQFHELYKISKDETVVKSLTKSFKNFLNSKEANDLFLEMRKAYLNNDIQTMVVTKYNTDLIDKIVSAKLNLNFGDISNLEYVRINKDFDVYNIIEDIRSKKGNRKIYFLGDNSLLKVAGIPISDDVKNKAKRIYKLLNSALEIAEQSLENQQNNLSEYEKIKNDHNAIAQSKGQYNQSVKNNTRIMRELLIKIRDAIKIFNEIKDISATTEIIDVLTTSSKIASNALEEIFDMIDQLDSADFFMLFSEKVKNYEKIIEDLESSIERGLNYVNGDILGIRILSE